ncbi:MAG: Eco57I restriction-modification methylase domain-containing protein [Oscillochloridaceae bacterium umkhey_bin13]
MEHEIAAWAHPKGGVQGFDWAVEFAEVFVEGGFDIVVANPPYVRQELIKALKPTLKTIYPEVYVGTADLYVYFYARALQSLRDGGMLCFITPNKWFRAGYGTRIREHMAATTRILSITDFGELPVFQSAATFPMIFITQKGAQAGSPIFTQVKDLAHPYPDVQAIIQARGEQLPAQAVQGANWILSKRSNALMIERMQQAGRPLGAYVNQQIYYGIKTGFNDAFVIDTATRDTLIARDPRSAEVIKPLAVGDDVRKWHVRQKDRWLIVTPIGVDIHRYPAIFTHLQQWQDFLEKRSDKGKFWWELRPCDYYHIFDQPKIVFPDIAKESRFTLDTEGKIFGNTVYLIATGDSFLLAVLNTSIIWKFASQQMTVLGDAEKGGRLRFFRQFVEQIPIPNAPANERDAIGALAQRCLAAQGQGAQVAQWEAEIDERVARLYGLSAVDLAAMRGE